MLAVADHGFYASRCAITFAIWQLAMALVFELAAGRVVIADEFFHDFDGRSAPFDLDVVVVSPSGDRVPMTACISQPLIHARPPRATGFVCTFDGTTKSAIPVGSRIVLPCA